MLSRRDLDFLLHEWLDVQSLCDRARFASLRRDHFDAVLAQASQLARGRLAPANRQLDEQEPRLTAEDVWTPPVLSEVMAAVRDAGLLAVSQDRALGGMQLPAVPPAVPPPRPICIRRRRAAGCCSAMPAGH